MTIPQSLYVKNNYGDYSMISYGSALTTDELKYFLIKGPTFKSCTMPWFSMKYDENDMDGICETLEKWNIFRDSIPFSSVEEFVSDFGGKFIRNNGIIDGDYNVCGLISLLGSRDIDSFSYRSKINSRKGEMISEDQLGMIAKDLRKKIYFLHSRNGNMSVVVLGDEKSQDCVVIHSTGSHFERIEW